MWALGVSPTLQFWETAGVSKLFRWLEHVIVGEKWIEWHHVPVTEMTLGNIRRVRVFPIWMSPQPLLKHAVDHHVVEDEEWIVWRRSHVQDVSMKARINVGEGFEVSYTSHKVKL